jgi:hypothetical protein
MLASGLMRNKTEVAVEERPFSVVAVTFFGQREVARYPTREQAEWRARELNAWAERNPRGPIQYLVRPANEPGRGIRRR